MPIAPTNPVGSPTTSRFNVPFVAVAGGADLTTEVFIAPRTGYITAARIVPISTITGAVTNNRTHSIVDPSTRATSGDGNTTSGSTAISSATAAFTQDDVGKAITGTNIPASTTIVSVSSATTAVLSAAATGTATTTVFTIGSSRTLATLNYTNGVNATGNAETDITLSGTDTRVFKGDVVQFVSTHIGTGIADPGGVLQLEMTAYGEGSD